MIKPWRGKKPSHALSEIQIVYIHIDFLEEEIIKVPPDIRCNKFFKGFWSIPFFMPAIHENKNFKLSAYRIGIISISEHGTCCDLYMQSKNSNSVWKLGRYPPALHFICGLYCQLPLYNYERIQFSQNRSPGPLCSPKRW